MGSEGWRTARPCAEPWTRAAGLRGGGAGQAGQGARPETDPPLTPWGPPRPCHSSPSSGSRPGPPTLPVPGPGALVYPSTCPEVCVPPASRGGSGGLRRAESVSRPTAASVCAAAGPQARLLRASQPARPPRRAAQRSTRAHRPRPPEAPGARGSGAAARPAGTCSPQPAETVAGGAGPNHNSQEARQRRDVTGLRA